jgi:hypothetical protein
MRKLIRSVVATIVLAATFGLVPSHAGAVGYEDSLDDCAYPAVFDVAVMRPLSMGAMVVGAVAYVATAPIWAFTIPSEAGSLAYTMMGSPADFAFKRPLGQCASVSAGY